ncbi:MAG: hypothetical protein EAZ60_18575 [Oscillatoriales cyanobacterium]|nr:MAG: hypothetical protein EAZ83_06155 [Oscillatoriales cyanobacterium]TAE95868.1 MAG: hypothetical protein EAZ79_17040 [Oscillatoriales cyanobacterium]TAF22454.1 MAG: hypothetical protein EAZ73_05150 [Oscillatoriales cyanobacterium]TAF36053.1 MAG: hypothetical protein EAZ69_11700 [Oscillatoriales cyanobacterium]TAF53897.1 MAG: hypothetical protein EAZ60_18575 [Oscillatoriales cyanobacterium]
MGVFNGIQAKNLEFPFGGKPIAGGRINFAMDKLGFLLKSHASGRSHINAVVVYQAIALS